MTEPRVVELTERERDVAAELACDGASNADIAERLQISVWTVKSHVREVLRKTGHDNRAALAVALLRRRVVVRVVNRRGKAAA